MIILKILTLIMTTFLLVIDIKKLKKGLINCVYVLYLVFYFFLIFPLLLDIVIGRPVYDVYNIGFINSYDDFTTESVYCIILIFSSAFLMIFGKKTGMSIKDINQVSINTISKRILIVLTTILVLLPTYYAINKTKVLGVSFKNVLNYNYLNDLFILDQKYLLYRTSTMISILSFILILLLSDKNIYMLSCIYFIPIYIAIGIHRKRSIVAILLFLYIFVILFKSKIETKSIMKILIMFMFLLISFSAVYQSNIRGIGFNKTSFDEVYTDFRIDYGRDDVVKMSVYYNLNDDNILKNNGNSNMYFLKFISDKFDGIRTNYKYSVYATSKLLGYSLPIDVGWGVTTGIYDESISNYGIIGGTILANLVLCLICRIGDRTKNIIAITFTYLISLCFIVLQLTSFAFIFLFWIIVCIVVILKRYIRSCGCS